MTHFSTSASLRACFVLAVLGVAGCQHGLVATMQQYNFTAISPPQTKWEVGSVIQVDPRFPNAPTLYSLPSEVPVAVTQVNSDAPAISNNENDKIDLQLGVSLPNNIKASLAANSVTQYSVTADGNFIVNMPLSPYMIDTFPKIADKFGSTWALPLGQKQLYYINALWFCKTLKYTFYNQNGAQVNASVPLHGVNVTASGDFTLTNDGSLVYNGPDPICVGYRARPVAKEQNGQVVAEGAANSRPTAGAPQAHRFVPASNPTTTP